LTATKAVILAAGIGTRLRPLTETTPKCLIRIAGRPLLDYWFASLNGAGISDVLINTHHLRDQVQDYISTKNQSDWQVTESYESELLGSAGTIRENPDWCSRGETCLIIYADNLSTVNLGEMIDFHHGHSDPFTMLLFRTDQPKRCGIATLDSDTRITEFVEKPQDPASNLANGGVYVLSADAYREIAEMNAFDIGFDVLPKFVGRMRGWEFDGYHLDIGSHANLSRANADVCRLFPRELQV
jgi:NDP-sugar pyrophosphorylase family protein